MVCALRMSKSICIQNVEYINIGIIIVNGKSVVRLHLTHQRRSIQRLWKAKSKTYFKLKPQNPETLCTKYAIGL